MVNVNTAANFINLGQNSVHRNATFRWLPCTKWGNYRLKLSLSAYYTRKLRTFNTSNRIVIVKRKYIFEVETPPHHIVSIKVTNATLVIYKVNMWSKNVLLKLNLISCHGNKRKLRTFTPIVSAHPYCASLLRMQIHMPRHP